jgi:hypothetical protein
MSRVEVDEDYRQVRDPTAVFEDASRHMVLEPREQARQLAQAGNSVLDVEVSLRGRLNHRPRSATQEDAYHPSTYGGNDIVIQPVADIGNFLRRHTFDRLDDFVEKNAGDGFSTPHVCDDATMSAGTPSEASASSMAAG